MPLRPTTTPTSHSNSTTATKPKPRPKRKRRRRRYPTPPDKPLSRMLGATIKDLRERYFIKQSVMAFSLECSEVAISYWERGMRIPNPEMEAKIKSALESQGAGAQDLDELTEAFSASRSVLESWLLNRRG